MSTAAAESPTTTESFSTAPLGRRWLAGTVVGAFLLTFLQAPGLTVADTKYDLAQNPLGFLRRAAHLWSSQAPMGQVQNQAYGYFFPHGSFFALGHALGLPAWVTQRIWWALLILAGFWGVVRLCEVLGIGTRGSRIVAALAFALSPRVLTTLGSISSETLPMMLAPWVLLAPAALGRVVQVRRGIRRAACETRSATEPSSGPTAHGLPTSEQNRPARRRCERWWRQVLSRVAGAISTSHRRGSLRDRSAALISSRRSRTTAPLDPGRNRLRNYGAVSPAGSALALALMGSVNAVATAAAFLPAVIWWASYQPNRAWWRFTRTWIPLLALGTLWWVVPLLMLGKVSPPFLDYIESSGVTTEWASLGEVLRGTDSWTPFVSPERIAGAVLVTQPAAVLATGLLAAAGMAGLALRSMPHRGRFVLIFLLGLVGICAGYVGELGGPFAESVRIFLDSGGAPLRNVHKLEPLIRLPLIIGLAHLLARVPLPGSVPMPVWRSAFAHPERQKMVAVAALILSALALSSSLAWTGKLAPRGAYDRVPAYWTRTADWLAQHAAGTRALVVPGAPFGSQIWGLTRDEPLQALARTPWAVRDAIPLTPPGTIRAMDSVQRLIADGRPSTGLAPTLIDQGIGILVLRNDLDPDTSRSTRPLLAHQAIEHSPGLTKVAEFGDEIVASHGKGLVSDGDLRPSYPAIEIYRVSAPHPGAPADIHSGLGAPRAFPGAYTVPLDSVPVVQGGPEVLERLRRTTSATPAPNGPVLLSADAARAGLSGNTTTLTDTPMDRETDFGRVDNHNSALRAPTDARRTRNLVPDYAVPGTPRVEGRWSGATITASSSAADATQLGGTAPGSSTAAAVDGDPSTAWLSNSAEHAVGQWLRLGLDHPITAGILHVTTSAAALGDPVKLIEVRTAHGTTAARIAKPGEPVSVSLPPGSTGWITITAIETGTGSPGGQFGISEVSLDDYSNRDAPVPVDIRHRTVLPPAPAGTQVQGWSLGQEFPGRSGCFDAPDRVRCSNGLALAAEEPGAFERTLNVPAPMGVTPQLMVRARQGPALQALLTDHDRPVARGKADVGDLRGSAFAATDGNPLTSWTAPQDTVSDPAGPKPTLTLELPAPALVSGLEIIPSRGALPARPTSVAVNLGDGPQTRKLDQKVPAGQPIRISLHPHVTDRIELSIATWNAVLDRTALGFDQQQPPGIAEVNVLGPHYPPPARGDRPVTIDCAHGPTIAVAGHLVHTTITATADQLLSSTPVPAQICGIDPIAASAGDHPGDSPAGNQPPVAPPGDRQADTIGSVALPSGHVDVTVAPTDLFSVDQLRLNRTDFTPRPVSAPSGTRLLVLPLSTNVGWRARTADGRELSPVVIDGWEQAWVLPPGTHGPITVEFPIDRWYRLAIFGGLLLLLPLIALVLPRPRRWWNHAHTPGSDDSTAGPEPCIAPATSDDPGSDTEGAGVRSDSMTFESGDARSIAEQLVPPDYSRPGRETPGDDPIGRSAHTRHDGAAPMEQSAAQNDSHSADHLPETPESATGSTDGDSRETPAPQNDSPPRTWNLRIPTMIGLTLAVFLISGPVAIVLAALGFLGQWRYPRITARVLVAVAGLGTLVSAAALSTGPWRSPDGYMGGSLWVQFPALVAVVALGVAALGKRRTG